MKPVDNQPPVLDPVEPFFTVEEVFYGSQQFQAATSSLSQSCNPAKYCQKPSSCFGNGHFQWLLRKPFSDGGKTTKHQNTEV